MVAIRKVRKRRARTKEDTMNLMQPFLAVPAAFLMVGNSVAIAGQTVDVAGAIACVMDKWDYMPDKSWKGAGTCTDNLKGGDKMYESWEEGSHLKEYMYKYTGGTGKYEGASGGGTYMYESLTDTITGGGYKGKLVLP
jgi:hypothetical protein